MYNIAYASLRNAYAFLYTTAKDTARGNERVGLASGVERPRSRTDHRPSVRQPSAIGRQGLSPRQ